MYITTEPHRACLSLSDFISSLALPEPEKLWPLSGSYVFWVSFLMGDISYPSSGIQSEKVLAMLMALLKAGDTQNCFSFCSQSLESSLEVNIIHCMPLGFLSICMKVISQMLGVFFGGWGVSPFNLHELYNLTVFTFVKFFYDIHTCSKNSFLWVGGERIEKGLMLCG